MKRVLDITASISGVILLSPLFLVLAVLIKMTSEGPVFYRGRRVGLRGRPFHIFKFRTMVLNADKIGGPSTSDGDPRITKIGKLMRKFKLDELPQLLNVLAGDMSLVGPRPQVQEYVDRFTDQERAILEIRPGITDWASIWNSDEGAVLAKYPDPDRAYDQLIHPTKTKLQLLYVRDHNVWIDLEIIISTFVRLVWKDWIPRKLRAIPSLATDTAAASSAAFETVTEMPGAGATSEQIAMLHTRYRLAGELAAEKEVLEVACGPGIGLGHLATRARRVVGGDCDAKLVEVARHRHRGRIEVRHLHAEVLPFADSSFDVVLLLEALYYLPSPEAFLQEARRVLRPGGTVLICSANCERPDFNPSPYSKTYYSTGQLRELLQRHGFDVQVFAAFPIAPQSFADRVRGVCRRVAISMRLIPKTMKWKARIKRLFFGRLDQVPVTLGETLPAAMPLTKLDGREKVPHFQVLYAIGTCQHRLDLC